MCDPGNGRLGAYLNTAISDLSIDGKGEYFRTLFGGFHREIVAALKANELALHSANKARQLSPPEICEWEIKENEHGGFFHTSCGELVQSILSIDGMQFCPYCSRKLLPC